MNLRSIAIAVAAVCVTLPAVADEAAPDTAGGRYIFSKIADGFVRLDIQTGAVAQCSQREVGWACVAAPLLAKLSSNAPSGLARLRGNSRRS